MAIDFSCNSRFCELYTRCNVHRINKADTALLYDFYGVGRCDSFESTPIVGTKPLVDPKDIELR